MRYRTRAQPEHVRPMGVRMTEARMKGVLLPEEHDEIVARVNKKFARDERSYQAGARFGFIYGLVCGALGIALLAVVVLGDVLSG
jgi:hypothetical protein